MVTTFTRRAAAELEVRVVERCDQLLHFAKVAGYAAADPQFHNLRIGTIHSLCDGLLAEFDTDYITDPGDGGASGPPRHGVAHKIPQGKRPQCQPGGIEGPVGALFPRSLGPGCPHPVHELGEDHQPRS
jgi:hypothetical protein